MPRKNRGDLFDPRVISYNHCSVRCVRKLFLLSNKSDKFRRRNLMTRRLQFLAQYFAIDVLCYALMDNHVHLVLRNRPDVVDAWTDEQVARQWLFMFPGKKRKRARKKLNSDNVPNDAQSNKTPFDPTQCILEANAPSDEAIQDLLSQPTKLAEIRVRLSDISWFMRAFNQHIAFIFNREDEVSGSFWQERFHLQALLDEEAILACSIYVDLNPIRAGIADSIEHSHFTSALQRIRTHLASDGSEQETKVGTNSSRPVAAKARPSFLAPLTIESDLALDPLLNRDGYRTSNHGFLRLDLVQYLKLLEYVGSIAHPKKRGKINPKAESILSHFNISLQTLETVLDPDTGIFRKGYRIELGKLFSASLAG